MMVFPVISGASGSDPIFTDLPDIDLELVDSQVFDGRTQQLSASANSQLAAKPPLGRASGMGVLFGDRQASARGAGRLDVRSRAVSVVHSFVER